MMAKGHPKAGGIPGRRSARTGVVPESFDRQTLCWHIGLIDWDHKDWGWRQISPEEWTAQIAEYGKNLETMTWAELLNAAGGRSAGTNHHPLPLDDLSKTAQERLVALKLDDADSIFSLRLTATIRVYGIRDGRVFKALWYDKHHGDPKRAVCPSSKKHT